jgi:hypothetical protein
MTETPNVGDYVAFACKIQRKYESEWSTSHGTVVSVGNGKVAIYRELDRGAILDGESAMRFVPLECVWPTREEAERWSEGKELWDYDH